jgi:hypothetical protein
MLAFSEDELRFTIPFQLPPVFLAFGKISNGFTEASRTLKSILTIKIKKFKP